MDSVNMVNAPVIARDRDIDVTEATNERNAEYHSLIRLTVKGNGSDMIVAGTLLADANPRIVHVNGIDIEAELAPNTLFVTNDDLPGFIGRLGMELGESGVNIATFHLGRKAAGGEAMSLIATDEPVSEEILAKIRELPLVNAAKFLRFV